ncbi:hypothetical protein [Methylorubrum extorquens]|uniref:hypothetical protein n=1 Tax=Methylorubrum extorquens TaxID=408 RepID=UPI0018C89283|nr:hypothetical protein [Methylorubrum extorquens]
MDPLQQRPDRDLQRGAAVPDSLGTGAHLVGTLLIGGGRGADPRNAPRHRAGVRCGPGNGTGDLVAGLSLLLCRRGDLSGDKAELGDRLPDLADGTARAARRLLDRRDR